MTDRHLRAVSEVRRQKYEPEIAQTVLRAAHVLRGRAAMAMPAPWTAWPAAGGHAEVVTSSTTGLTVGVAPPPIDDVGWSVAPGTADYIATMGPDLAEHIATWLENLHHRMTVDGFGFTPAEESHAHFVARAILREEPT